MADREATGAKVLATGNPGCQMQIGAGACLNGMSLRVCHPVELLDESYQKAGFYSEEPRSINERRKTQPNRLVYLRTDIDPHGDCRLLYPNNTPSRAGLLLTICFISYSAPSDCSLFQLVSRGFQFSSISGLALLDLYQAVASFFGLWPMPAFLLDFRR